MIIFVILSPKIMKDFHEIYSFLLSPSKVGRTWDTVPEFDHKIFIQRK